MVPGGRDPFRLAWLGEGRRAGPLLRTLREGAVGACVVLSPPGEQAGESFVRAVEDDLPDGPVVRAAWPGSDDFPGGNERVSVMVDGSDPDALAKAVALLGQGTLWSLWLAGPEPVEPGDAWHWIAAGAGGATVSSVSSDAVYEPVRGATATYRVGSVAGKVPSAAPALEPVLRDLGLVGRHPAWQKVLSQCQTVAPHAVPVLVEGETGTGKELVSRLIHRLSPRVGEPFVAVNCGALPSNLVESLLFGHRKGAFTGAQHDQAGKFLLADGGTLFLDEIGELPLDLQPKLLRALEDGTIEPLGAGEVRRVDVRIIAATHRHLREAVATGKFREDLYYRLAFASVRLPSLRERTDDIPLLAEHFLRRFCKGLAAPRRLGASAINRLAAHPWPGNVRDLENVVGRSALWCPREVIEEEDLLFDHPAPVRNPDEVPNALPVLREGFSLEAYLGNARRLLMLRALELAGGNKSAAARLLGITPQAVHRFVREESGASSD